MTPLDEALEKYIADNNKQAQYYDLVLNTDFFIPIKDDGTDTPIAEQESVAPLVLKSESKHYVLMFDTEERVNSWSKEPIKYMILAGYEMVKYTPAELYWAVNIGGQFAKEFVPDEIDHLRQLLQNKA